MKTLIIYYSYTGNTRMVAEILKEKIGGDLIEIKPVVPYSDNYNLVVENAKKEISDKYKPEIENLDIDVQKYDRVVLGTPVWWYTFAPAVRTFLESCDLAGKDIYPFATNGGWLGHTFEEIKKLCPDSNVHEGIDIYFVANKLRTSQKEIENWADGIK